MKVAIAAGLYPPEIGGPATYALLIEDELPKRGVAVVMVPFGWVRHYPKIIRHIVYMYKLWQESKSADIIYALDPVSVGLPAAIVSKIIKKPLLIRLGGDYAWEQGRVRFGLTETLDEYLTKKPHRPLMVRLLASVQTWVTNQATKVIAPSEYLKGVIAQWGVPRERIVVVYSALYPLSVSGTKEELRAQLSYTKPTLVTAGRLVPWKGFPAVIEMLHSLLATHPDSTLIIAGDGEEEQMLRTLVKEKNLDSHVRFIGRVSKDALGAVIKAADVFVLNTAYEGLSHQLIEVMDVATPIVTTTAGGNPELITHNVNGFLVEFNDVPALLDATKRLLDYPETRDRITKSARARAKDFSEDKMLTKLVEVLCN
jgi:glycosyltransferase involved in cell wall biosynthesis